LGGCRADGRGAPLLCVALWIAGALALGACAVAAEARFEPPLRLGPDDGVVQVSRFLWFREDVSEERSLGDVLAEPSAFERNRAPIFNPGTASGIMWLAFDVQSTAAQTRRFVVSLDRATVEMAEVHLVRGDARDLEPAGGAEQLLADTEAARAASLMRFRTLAVDFRLAPGERASVVVRFRGANWSGIQMLAAEAEAFEADRQARLALFLLLTGAVGTLVLYGAISFVFLGPRIVLLYAAAQVALFVFQAHMMGYTAAYLWPGSPESGRLVSPVSFGVLVVAMAQFGRVFFETRRRALGVDRVLAACVVVGGLALVALLLEAVAGGIDRRIPNRTLYGVAIVCWSVLPVLAVVATLRWSRDFWPMAVAWSTMSLFILSMIAVFTGLIPTVPLGERSYIVIVFLEASLLAVALALRVRGLREEALEAQQRLTESLRRQLAESQRARRLSEERSWALQDLVEKGRLLVAAGHDSRQMVGALRLYAAGLRRRASEDDVAEATRGLDDIADGLEEVLSAAVAGSGSGGIGDRALALDTVTASGLLGPLQRIHTRAAREKGIDLRVRPSECLLVTDRVLVMRVLGNLVSNAIKYTDAGAVLVGLRRRGDGCAFQVRDTGRGIAPAALELLMSPAAGAVRVDDREEGSGSGLGIAKAVTARLGGTLTARSWPGRGSVFELELPHCRSAHAPVEGLRAVALEGEGGGDEALARAAQALGLALHTANTPDAARALLEDAPGPAPLLLIDQHFGGVDAGLDLAHELGAGAGDPRVALLSYDRSSEARARLAQDAPLVLYKPVSALALAAAVRRLAAPGASRHAASRSFGA